MPEKPCRDTQNLLVATWVKIVQISYKVKMPYKAIIFDLYGTLVGNFSRQAYDKVQEQMAIIIGVPAPKFWQTMAETINDRSLGANRTVE